MVRIFYQDAIPEQLLLIILATRRTYTRGFYLIVECFAANPALNASHLKVGSRAATIACTKRNTAIQYLHE